MAFDWCETLAFVEEFVKQYAAVTASPGFTWGKSGNIVAGTFLWNDTVPSNKAGRTIPLKNGSVTKIFVANENDNTFEVELLKRTGVGVTISAFTSIASVSLTAERVKVGTFENVNLAEGDELATRILSGSCKNPVVGVIIRGTNA